MTKLEVERTESAGLPILRLKGRVTFGESSRDLRGVISAIADEGHKHLLLDLSLVSYVDSSGLGALVAGYNSLKLKGGAIGLFEVPDRIRNLLVMSRLDEVFRLFGTEREAASGMIGTPES